MTLSHTYSSFPYVFFSDSKFRMMVSAFGIPDGKKPFLMQVFHRFCMGHTSHIRKFRTECAQCASHDGSEQTYVKLPRPFIFRAMSDIEHLIIAVEAYPCLWDTSHEDYHNRDLKELAWQAIAKEIYSDWETYEGIKKTSTCNSLKKKWTYIRDYYRKDQQRINNTPSGSGAKPEKKPYTYAPFLEFLKPTLKRRKIEGNYDNDEDVQNEPNDMESNLSNHSQDMESSLLQNDNAILETPAVAPVNTTSRASTTTKVTRTKKDVPEKILSILERRATQPPSTEASTGATEDDDVKFLLSFREYMKKMSPSQKLDFKIEMLQVVKRTINNSQSPYSRPSTANRDYTSNFSAHNISSPLVRRINPSDSSYSRPSTANSVPYISSPSPTSNSSVQALTSPLIPTVNIQEQGFIDTNLNSIENSQIVVVNSEHDPIETYLTFKNY